MRRHHHPGRMGARRKAPADVTGGRQVADRYARQSRRASRCDGHTKRMVQQRPMGLEL